MEDPGRARLAWSHGELPSAPRIRAFTVAMAGVAGFTDAVGWMTLFGVFTSNMTGNTSKLGISLGEGHFANAVSRLFPIPVFVVGIAVGAVIFEVARRMSRNPPIAVFLAIQAAMISGFMFLGLSMDVSTELERNSALFFLLTALLAAAMGLQTAALRRVGSIPVHTTFMSGMLLLFAVQAIGCIFAGFDRRRGEDPDESPPPDYSPEVLRFAGTIWLGFLGGAFLGSLGITTVGLWALGLPICVLAFAVVLDLRGNLVR
ncbi:MAG: hypothetical protein JJLCMIEE_00258 [Acidimicrobiales bacterium]|nr:hypothetical protein [Acidimicrobiales bacterium]